MNPLRNIPDVIVATTPAEKSRAAEHLLLADAQDRMRQAAYAIDLAAREREAQGDARAEQDAATYRLLARLLHGTHDLFVCELIELTAGLAWNKADAEGIAQLVRDFVEHHGPGLLRAIKNGDTTP